MKKNRMWVQSSKWLLLLLFGLINTVAFGQKSIVTGTVTSTSDNSPIPGVTVTVKGTTQGTITDIDGKYTIKVFQNKTLVFSFIGMQTEEVVAKGGLINVSLKEENVNLEEIVAIGYGTQKKKELSGAVVQVKAKELTKISTSDIGAALQGQVAGVNVQSSSGAPGASSNIQIRGVSSIDGSNTPLFVVDGIPQEGDPKLSNNEIETIDILKDAASCAIYGTRGAAGVILITTKQGQKGGVKIKLDSYGGVQKITSGMELMDFEDYWYQFYTYKGQTQGNHVDDMWTALWNNPSNFTNNTNIVDAVQNDNAVIQSHSLNIYGGNQDLRFSVVGSYFNQEGIMINSGLERFNLRSNTNLTKGKWTIALGLGMRIDEREREPYNLLYDAYKYKPYQVPLNVGQTSADDAGDSANDNDAIQMGTMLYKFSQSDVENSEQLNGSVNIKLNIAKGLDISTRVGGNVSNAKRIVINPPLEMYDTDGDKIERSSFRSKIKNTHSKSTSLTWESGVNYLKRINDHKFKLLGVFSTEKYTYSQFYASKMDLTSEDVTVIEGGTSDPDAGSGTGQWGQDRTSTLVGMLGRFQYDYKGRYLLSASVRNDGSSRFAENNKWGLFKSVSAAWNIADESFWSTYKGTVNAFKLRGSYGETGNQNFSDYAYAASITTGYDYPLGDGNLANGSTQSSFANANVKWETTKQMNIGVDMGLFKNKLTITADVYQSNKEDMLFPLLLPLTMGVGTNQSVILNVGDMTNKGVEFAMGWRHSGKVNWTVNATYSQNVNEISKMSGSTDISYFSSGWVTSGGDKVTAIKEGYEAGAFFVMETDGIVNTEAKLAEYQKLLPTALMGDLIYVDQNGDGQLNDSDRIYGGSGMSDFELGLNASVDYKGFDLSMQWYASVGNEIINGSKLYSMKQMTHQDLLYQWSEANPYAQIPAFRGDKHWNNRDWADIWVEDGSFVRLRNVTLGYSIPKSVMSKIGISSFRFYVASDNPLTITKYKGYDPEVGGNGLATRGIDRGNYPIAAQYRAGIQLGF